MKSVIRGCSRGVTRLKLLVVAKSRHTTASPTIVPNSKINKSVAFFTSWIPTNKPTKRCHDPFALNNKQVNSIFFWLFVRPLSTPTWQLHLAHKSGNCLCEFDWNPIAKNSLHSLSLDMCFASRVNASNRMADNTEVVNTWRSSNNLYAVINWRARGIVRTESGWVFCCFWHLYIPNSTTCFLRLGVCQRQLLFVNNLSKFCWNDVCMLLVYYNFNPWIVNEKLMLQSM